MIPSKARLNEYFKESEIIESITDFTEKEFEKGAFGTVHKAEVKLRNG
jgi:hypothetical protein